MVVLIAASKAWTFSIGVGFTFLILMPALATALIVVMLVSAKGEKAQDAELEGRWGRGRTRSHDV